MSINKDDILCCDICGTPATEKIVEYVTKFSMCLCSKHKKQMYAYGHITDPTARTTHDKNEYIIHNEYAEIVLRDKQNNIIDKALIDIDDVERCKTLKWSVPSTDITDHNRYVRAKNTKVNTSLHRFILGYDGAMDVDHINRNTMDNRKSNLRIVPRTVNNANNGKECITQLSDGVYRIFVQRYGKRYYKTVHGTRNDAVIARDAIYADIENNKDALMAEYNQNRIGVPKGICLLPSGKWQATYCVDGTKIRSGHCNTMDEAVAAREELIRNYNTGGVACAV